MNKINNLNSDNLKLLIKLWKKFEKKRKRQLIFLFFLMIISGISEIFTIAALVPFLVVITNPEKLFEIAYVNSLSNYFNIQSPEKLLIPITIIFALTAIVAAGIRLFNLWLNGKISAKIGNELSNELYLKILSDPYEVQTSRNTSEIITLLTTQIGQTIAVINSSLSILTSFSVLICILIMLLVVNYNIALITIVLFGGSYLIIAKKAKNKLSINSKASLKRYNHQVKFLQEGLGAIRDVLLSSSQYSYLKIYKNNDMPLRNIEAQNTFLRVFPRYVIEAIGICIISFFALVISLGNSQSLAVITTLGTLAVGAQRLLPSLQMIYSCWAMVSSFNQSVKNVLRVLNKPFPNKSFYLTVKPYNFRNLIHLENVSFSYANKYPILKNIDLVIKKGDRIGIVGSTGSGKSTLIDIIIGLLKPTLGRVVVDGFDLHNSDLYTIKTWRRCIGNVPQNIFLTDSSIAENIAFGVPPKEINMEKVKIAAKKAQLTSFIENNSEGYQRIIGERGIALSGGQRQRIAIARTLYQDPKILVFDEATSSLDLSTEKLIIEEVEMMSRELTLIMIAHRTSTLKKCNKIIEINEGRISYIKQ